LLTFQTLSSNRHFALFSSPDFHALIVSLESCSTYLATSLDRIQVSISHLASSVLALLLHTTILISYPLK